MSQLIQDNAYTPSNRFTGLMASPAVTIATLTDTTRIYKVWITCINMGASTDNLTLQDGSTNMAFTLAAKTIVNIGPFHVKGSITIKMTSSAETTYVAPCIESFIPGR